MSTSLWLRRPCIGLWLVLVHWLSSRLSDKSILDNSTGSYTIRSIVVHRLVSYSTSCCLHYWPRYSLDVNRTIGQCDADCICIRHLLRTANVWDVSIASHLGDPSNAYSDGFECFLPAQSSNPSVAEPPGHAEPSETNDLVRFLFVEPAGSRAGELQRIPKHMGASGHGASTRILARVVTPLFHRCVSQGLKHLTGAQIAERTESRSKSHAGHRKLHVEPRPSVAQHPG